MIQTDQNPIILEEQFYKDKHFFSYSGISKLLHSPRLFYSHYILNKREEKKEAHMIEGSVIHCMLLDNGSFNDHFVVTPTSLPGESNRAIIDTLHKRSTEPLEEDLEMYADRILDILREINLHQKLTTDQMRIGKVINEQTTAYHSFLLRKDKKEIIDMDTYTECSDIVSIIRAREEIGRLMMLDEESTKNELLLKADVPGKSFGLKGFIDNLVVDHRKKKIHINDLKRTSKSLSDFKDTVEYYQYWLQACIYKSLVKSNYRHLADYEIVFTFVVVDKYKQVYPFEVSQETMRDWKVRFEDVLDRVDYHYSKREYELPYEFAKKQVIL